MEWLDYADCAGDDPLKWDLDHVEADDVQAYARSVCGDCPVRRECAAHAIDDRVEAGRIFNDVAESANESLAIVDRIEAEGVSVIAQTGVIRGGVALVPGCEKLLYEAAGRMWHGCVECASCGRLLYKDGTPKERRPAGSVQYAARGMCSSCAYGSGIAKMGRKGAVSPQTVARAREATSLREKGVPWSEVADRLGVTKRTAMRYVMEARNGQR